MVIRSFAETELEQNAIAGVVFKQLRSYPDQRGFFREVIRGSDPFFTKDHHRSSAEAPGFAQWSHSKMGRDTVKAWHYHHLQVDWWYVGIGVIQTVLIDMREESPTFRRKLEFKLGEDEFDPEALVAVVRIPQGVFHGCKVLTDSAHLFYITSEIYNPEDEGRVPFNTTEVDHSWGDERTVITAENDRRSFPPKNRRIVLA